jgi:hypothetical protein
VTKKIPTHKRTQSYTAKPNVEIEQPKPSHFSKAVVQPAQEKILHCLKDSLKLFEKIQNNFEMNAIDNKTRENEIKEILKDIKVADYPHISDFEKKLITEQIAESSTQRVKNYENLFNIINTSLKDLKVFLVDYFNKGKP